jgi:hypothetical protein
MIASEFSGYGDVMQLLSNTSVSELSMNYFQAHGQDKTQIHGESASRGTGWTSCCLAGHLACWSETVLLNSWLLLLSLKVQTSQNLRRAPIFPSRSRMALQIDFGRIAGLQSDSQGRIT